MSTFCLVHGAFEGRCCWDLLVPYLETQGHKTITMNLPIDNAEATLSEYASVVIQAIPKTDEDIVLVGHSMAGAIIPLVAEAVKVRQLVFVTGLIPHPGISTIDQLELEPNILEAATVGKDFTDEAVLMEFCFHDCQPDVARWAISKQRPQKSTAHLFEKNPLTVLPLVECKYIVGADDRILSPTWSRYAARKHLGVDAIELPSGHSPHLSCPNLLASILLDCSMGASPVR
jgi:pimeloyl-ACP methyl ester carboxylesterase